MPLGRTSIATLASLGVACASFFAPSAAGAPGSMVALGVGANANTVFKFEAGSPSAVTSVPVSGLNGFVLVGIDYRPTTRELYGLGVNGTSAVMYTLDPATGAATTTGAAVVNSIAGATAFGIDFSSVSDRLRVVNNLASDGGGLNVNNFRLTPTGTVAGIDLDGDFTGLPGGNANAPNVAIAYDRSFVGAPATTLFGILSGGDRLVRQGGVDGVPSPNNGVFSNIGLLGVDTSNNAGFDIDPATGGGYAVLEVGGVSGLYQVNLATGAATSVGSIGNGTVDFGSLSIEPPAPPLAQPPLPPMLPEANLESLKVSPNSFTAARVGAAILSKAKEKAPVGTTVSYRLSAPAVASFGVERLTRGRKVGKKCMKKAQANREKKPCTRKVAVKGSFSHTGAGGENSFKFRGRIGNRTLAPGTYNLIGSVASSVRRAKFKIVP